MHWLVLGLAGYGAAHLLSTGVGAVRGMPRAPRTPPRAAAALTAHQQPLVSALSRLLAEDGVPEAERWATAIVRAAPTDDLGYLALVTAQIRRESRFLAPDLEWLYHSLVPDLVHELGVDDPVHTIGPMQVQSWRLQDHFEHALGRRLDSGAVQSLAADVETGVAACVAVLDRIVTDYVPDRRIRGWAHQVGPAGLLPTATVLARDWLGSLPAARHEEALRQKLLSDLTGEPLALDGVLGSRTEALLGRRPELASRTEVHARWRERFGDAAPAAIAPRIAHDPRLAFVLADFNAGAGACRVAATQALLDRLFDAGLAADGKWGRHTRAAVPALLAACVADEAQRLPFAELLTTGSKPAWLRARVLAMARQCWRERHGTEAPDALVPDLWFDGFSQEVKGIGRISVEGYVAGSVAFFEDYLRRLLVYTGAEPSAATPRGQ